MAQYTTEEALEIAPKFIAALKHDVAELVSAFERRDWTTVYRQVQNCQWDATNLKGIARDEMTKSKEA